MTYGEVYYRKVISAVGFTMLLFLALINAVEVLLEVVNYLLPFLVNDFMAIYVIYQLLYAAGYLLSFMLPVALLKCMIKRAGYPYHSMRSPARVTPWIFLILPAAVTVVFAVVHINSALVDILDYSVFSQTVLWGDSGQKYELFQIVLDFIVVCVVPGFCEEFLFRGAILTNCMPFGRSNAILISSFLFALMHQNSEQLLYTFAAGILLGLIYERTGSIWNCTILHIFNNFVSTVESVLLQSSTSLFQSSLLYVLFETGLFAVGTVCLMLLIRRFFAQADPLQNGIFAQSSSALRIPAAHALPARRIFKLFLSPSMIVFLILSAVPILFFIFLSGMNHAVGFM